MYQARDREAVNTILHNPTLWSESVLQETLQLFRKSNLIADSLFNTLDVQELIKDYLLTLSDSIQKEEQTRKKRKLVRILMAKLGDGYVEAMKTLTLAFRDAGYEVIYTDIQKPEAIVVSAIQECVDHIGITTLPGANIENLAKVVELLKKEDSSHIRVTAGGYLEQDKIPKVKEMGIVEFFPLGTTIQELIQWARDNIKST
jgi:methylmalonyl-CoA mutase C-terminal domain/subunit